MKSSFDDLISDVEKLDDDLRNPESYHLSLQGSYHKAAYDIAYRVLMAAMPADAKPSEWRRKVERLCSRITTEIMLGGGMVVRADGADDATGDVQPSGSAQNRITIHEIARWVQAGEAGEPGGKILTAKDRQRMAEAGGGERGYYAIAEIVRRAYYSSKPIASYGRLRRAIQRYTYGLQDSSGEPLLDAVAVAWNAYFEKRFARDMREYASGLVAKF